MVFQREYGKNVDFTMNESSVDKNIVPEYSELLNVDENSKSATEAKPFNNNNSNVNINNNISNNNITTNITATNMNTGITTNTTTNNGNAAQFGDIEMTSVGISAKPAISLNTAPTVGITQQTETRRPDGKRRVTPKFVPFSMDQDG